MKKNLFARSLKKQININAKSPEFAALLDGTLDERTDMQRVRND